jgi:hypothetical protein
MPWFKRKSPIGLANARLLELVGTFVDQQCTIGGVFVVLGSDKELVDVDEFGSVPVLHFGVLFFAWESPRVPSLSFKVNDEQLCGVPFKNGSVDNISDLLNGRKFLFLESGVDGEIPSGCYWSIVDLKSTNAICLFNI